MTRIILIGYMGAGKTTIGKALSKELGVIFYDLDWYIESRMRKSVAQIFAERGEEGFRYMRWQNSRMSLSAVVAAHLVSLIIWTI